MERPRHHSLAAAVAEAFDFSAFGKVADIGGGNGTVMLGAAPLVPPGTDENFSTILGWSYYGEKAAEYLFGTGVIRYYRWLWVVTVMVGSVVSIKSVWTFADITNGLMAIPNLISLIALSGVLVAETREHLWEKKDAVQPVSKETT